LREVINAHGLFATKALGQNFLFDEQLLDRLAAIPGSLMDANVLEVGPGPGGLTRALLRAGAKVTAIEMDKRALPVLEELSQAFPGRLTVIHGDATKVDPASIFGAEPYAIVANLPYNVGTNLFTGWLSGATWPPQWTSLTLMFQLEVAERIIAQPGSDAYGRLAVLSQWRSRAKIAVKVHRSAFTPPPKVMSAMVHVVPGEAPEGVSPRAGTRDRGRLRPAPQDAAPEFEGRAGHPGSAGNAGHRSGSPRRNAGHRGFRGHRPHPVLNRPSLCIRELHSRKTPACAITGGNGDFMADLYLKTWSPSARCSGPNAA
jgi:16S rRNA (adenine1518-N6/adenine1519-N6)-dimethyltransferase